LPILELEGIGMEEEDAMTHRYKSISTFCEEKGTRPV
jgi:hypothetical protein